MNILSLQYAYRADSAASNEDENPTRGNWSGSYEFLLSSLGMAVGLGDYYTTDNGKMLNSD